MSLKKSFYLYLGICAVWGFVEGFVEGYYGETPLVIRTDK